MQSPMPSLRITDIFSYGEESDGQWLVIECEDTAGKHFTLRIPHQIELGFFARFQAASLVAAQKRRSSPDREIEGALIVERVTFGVTKLGKVGICIRLGMGMELDMTLSDVALEHFKQALTELDSFHQSGGPGLTQ